MSIPIQYTHYTVLYNIIYNKNLLFKNFNLIIYKNVIICLVKKSIEV